MAVLIRHNLTFLVIGVFLQYHHMINYLKLRGASIALTEQTERYKTQLWKMKDGVLSSNYFRQLPTSLQMELIFDINVGHFHDTMLFRDCGKPTFIKLKY